jgi:hypothetical protein
MTESSSCSRAQARSALALPVARAVVSVLCAAALALALAKSSLASAPLASAPSTPVASIAVNIDTAHPGAVIPQDFLGLSFETAVLHSPAVLSGAPALTALLHNLGPGVMRISGVSVDRTQWMGSPEAPAPWGIATITPADLTNLASLMGASGWRLLLGLNLGHKSAPAIVEEARTASAILGGSLEGVMIGNEPDLYTHPPTAAFRRAIGAAALRAPGWGIEAYEREIANLRAELAFAGVPAALYGPDTATSLWLEPYADAQATGLAALAQHFYPLDRCRGGRLLRVAASPRSLLSAGVARREARDIAAYMRVAVGHRLALRIDEANSVACAGQPGTSDTFAAALWAVDFSLIAARRGVAGVNFHGGLGSCSAGGTIVSPWYSPLCTLPDGRLHARPEYYALLLLRSLEGRAFVPATYRTSQNISVHALRAADGSLRVVIDDMEETAARRSRPGTTPAAPAWVTLRVGRSYRRASVTSLRAPALKATGEVSLGGSSLGGDGLIAAPHSEPLRGRGGSFLVRVRPASVTVVSLGA